MTPSAPPAALDAERVALVVGATGLVGRELVQQLLLDGDYDRVRTFVRRPSGQMHEKLDERVVDFASVEPIASAFAGEVLFSALGTTRAVAGGFAAQHAVDYGLNLALAQTAAQRGVPAYVLVSAGGAHPRSPFFYTRMKGRLERAVLQLPFQSIRILRPGLLDGPRTERRPLEAAALGLLRPLPGWALPAALRPVPVSVVARAMRTLAADWSPGAQIVLSEQIALLGGD